MLALMLGAAPGCLGAFVLVALFTHRRLSAGALVAGMIATSGDETELDGMSTHPCHVVVVGGGPASLMTAVVDGECGHRVTLLEKGLLRGQFALSFLAPGKEALVRTFTGGPVASQEDRCSAHLLSFAVSSTI